MSIWRAFRRAASSRNGHSVHAAQVASRIERHEEPFALQIALEGRIRREEVVYRFTRAWPKTRKHRPSVDVRILNDQVAAFRDQRSVGRQLLQHVILPVIGV